MRNRMDRRRFVWTCLGAAASASLVLTGCDGGEVTAEELPAAASLPTATSTSVPTQAEPTAQPQPVHPAVSQPAAPRPRQFVSACPRRLVNDPYPGRCRLYIDKKGDGICDLSQAV